MSTRYLKGGFLERGREKLQRPAANNNANAVNAVNAVNAINGQGGNKREMSMKGGKNDEDTGKLGKWEGKELEQHS